VFVALSCIYLLLARGGITSSDEGYIFGTAESLAEHGSWRMNVAGIERPFSRYSLVPSIIGVPFYLAARPMAERFGIDSNAQPSPGLTRRDVLMAAVTLQTPFVTAATAALLFFGLCKLGFRPGPAMGATAVFALGTLAFPYSGSLYVQPAGALALTCVLFCAALDCHIGLALSLALLLSIRLEMLAIVPVLAMHLLKFRRPRARSLCWLVAGTLLGFSIQVLINVLRDDHWLKGDYGGEAFSTPMWLGLWSVLFSSGKGLAWFAPAAAAGLVLLPFFAIGRPRIGLLTLGIVTMNLIMVACWWTWHGSWSWGPRLLVPIMPALMLPLAWFFERWSEHAPAIRWLVIIVVVVSVAAQLCGVVRDPLSDRTATSMLTGGNENESIYIPQVGPWGAETDAKVYMLLVRLWQQLPQSHMAISVIAGVLVVTAVSAGLWALFQVGIGTNDIRAILPRAQPAQLLAAAVCLVCFSVPTAVEWLLLARAQGQTDHETGVPVQFQSFQLSSSNGRWTGTLYVPLSGAYVFFQQAPNVSQFYLKGHPVFPTVSGPLLIGMEQDLSVGFHRLEFDSVPEGRSVTLYWTTPGNAHYKEPVPRLYLAGPIVSQEQQWAIALAHWKWVIWTLGIVAAIFASNKR
jgi:hypothetical protein